MNRPLPCAVVVAACALAACNDQPTGPAPATLEIVQAPSAVGAPGWELIDTLKVRAVDPEGQPLAGVRVIWDIRQGGGSVAAESDVTDADGISAAVWTLGAAGGLNGVRASVLEGGVAEFHATGEAFRVERLASRWGLGCGLVDGVIWCWGDDFWASGDPVSHNGEFGWSDYGPVRVEGGSGFVDLALGGSFLVCGLDAVGSVSCASQSARELAPVVGLPPVWRLSNSRYPQCGLAVADSTPWCWGSELQAAQLPGVPALSDLSSHSSGGGPELACGLRPDSTTICWGDGPLGDGSSGSSSTPVVVAGGHQFVELAVGSRFACGRASTGDVWCWGEDGSGQKVLTPSLVSTGSFVLGAEAQFAQVLTGPGGITRWERAGSSPVEHPGGVEAVPIDDFAANGSISCMQTVDMQVYCFDEMFERSSVLGWHRYSPVQPLRRASPASNRQPE